MGWRFDEMAGFQTGCRFAKAPGQVLGLFVCDLRPETLNHRGNQSNLIDFTAWVMALPAVNVHWRFYVTHLPYIHEHGLFHEGRASTDTVVFSWSWSTMLTKVYLDRPPFDFFGAARRGASFAPTTVPPGVVVMMGVTSLSVSPGLQLSTGVASVLVSAISMTGVAG